MTMRVGLVINPTAGRGRGSRMGEEATRALESAGVDVVHLSADTAAEATTRARAAAAEGGIEALVVSGGDGMAHLGANICAGTGLPLGIIATGTGNDIARELGLPVQDPAASVRRIVDGTARVVDAARHTGVDGGHRWFVGVLAAGFDAVVNERANRWRWPRGQMRYNLAMLRELPVFRPISYAIEVDGTSHDTAAMLVAVGNGPAYGGGMKVVPSADFEDGLLDVLILHELRITEFLRVFPTVFSGAHVDHPSVEVVRGRHVRLDASGIVGYADGERFGPLPLDIEAVPGALTVLG